MDWFQRTLLLIFNYIYSSFEFFFTAYELTAVCPGGCWNTDPSSKLEVVGAGITSATTALKVGNASSTIFSVRNDGLVEVASTTQGFLPPRVELISTAAASNIISNPATGLLVYNTATAGTGATAVTPGFYYFSGSAWVRLIVPTDNAANVSGTVAVANGGTGATTLTGILKGNGTSALTAAIAGTDYLAPTGSAASLTNFPTFNQNTTGNAATATTAGNITATTNTTLTSLSNLATVGTITSGVWSGTTVAVAKGGTGLTAPGAIGNVLTSNGTIWTSAAPSGGAITHSLGEAFGGGIVFYVTSDGLHGLIAETQNLSSKCFWRDAQDEISKSSNHSTAGKLFSDWRLPTANELDLLLTYSIATGLVPGLNTWYYWTSTEFSGTAARIQGYPSLDRTAVGVKYGTDLYEVRPIRSF